MKRNGDVMRSDRLKQVMQEIDSTFDEKDLGMAKFSRFAQEAAQRGLIRVTEKARERRLHTRPAAKPVRWRCREAWRLDFRVLSSKTAGTVARDGCEQGLAVYSVRS